MGSDGEEEWASWIDMEEIRDPPSPYVVYAFAWCVILAVATIVLLVRC